MIPYNFVLLRTGLLSYMYSSVIVYGMPQGDCKLPTDEVLQLSKGSPPEDGTGISP